MTRQPSKPTISAIIPVYYGGDNFRKCLLNIAESKPPPEEIFVVADGDTDGSWRFAEEFGMQVLRIPTTGGPAQARNLGAKAAKEEVLLFVDADVTIPHDSVNQISAAFHHDPELSAVFGSYDDDPAEPNFLSQYKNLFHHYVHQTSHIEASTFWAGCGAVRRDIFQAMDGFNEGYRHPSVEDIELGYRLKRAGHKIRLLKSLKVKHLKRWDIMSLLKADFLYRALPWTRLIIKEGRFIDDLNLKLTSRISVICIYMIIITLLLTLFIPWLFVPAFFFMMLLFALNRDLYRFFKDKRGLFFAVKTIPWHWFYFFYSGMAFFIGYVNFKIKRNIK